MNAPGKVVVLGPDIGNGSPLQLANFRSLSNATYPLLQLCADGAALADTNLENTYFQRHNFVVINSTGIIRYHANDSYGYGNRYHVDELRAVIDSLIPGTLLDVDEARPPAIALSATPNPSRGATTIELSNPGPAASRARVTVHDLAGRRVADPWDAPAPPGVTRIAWDGRGEEGSRLGPGVYLVSAEIGGARLTRRVVLLR